jgi:hypothetical protein
MTDNDYVAELRSYGGRLTNEAADRIEALTAERDRAIDDARDNAEYVDLVSQYRAERDAAVADNARLLGMVDKCQSIAKDAVSMCNEGIPVSAKNVAIAVLRALTGKETK